MGLTTQMCDSDRLGLTARTRLGQNAVQRAGSIEAGGALSRLPGARAFTSLPHNATNVLLNVFLRRVSAWGPRVHAITARCYECAFNCVLPLIQLLGARASRLARCGVVRSCAAVWSTDGTPSRDAPGTRPAPAPRVQCRWLCVWVWVGVGARGRVCDLFFCSRARVRAYARARARVLFRVRL